MAAFLEEERGSNCRHLLAWNISCKICVLQAIFACVFEACGTLKLKHSGMEFAVWTFKHAASEPLAQAAKPALQGLLMLLDNGRPYYNAH